MHHLSTDPLAMLDLLTPLESIKDEQLEFPPWANIPTPYTQDNGILITYFWIIHLYPYEFRP